MTKNLVELLTANNIGDIIAAVGGLGTAAYGLVDVSKSLLGGLSHAGFGYVRRAVTPLTPDAANAAMSRQQILKTLRANWLNGVAKSDQKAIAKSLIRIGLTSANANALAAATGVSAAGLATATTKIENGTTLDQNDLNILGRLDAVLSAKLDYAYERGDQTYRNVAKLVAAAVAVVLAVIGGTMVTGKGLSEFLFSQDGVTAILIGAISTPLAPIAKDLSSALAAAVKAVSLVKR